MRSNRNRPLSLPNTIGDADLDAAATRLRELEAELASAATAVRAAEAGTKDAEEADLQAQADARRTGSVAPEADAAAKPARERLAAAQREHLVLDRAAGDARSEFEARVKAARTDLMGRYETDEAEARKALLKRVRDLEDALSVLDGVRARQSWLAHFPSLRGQRPKAGHLRSRLRQPNGEGYPVPELVAALREVADPPPPAEQSFGTPVPRGAATQYSGTR